ncbi:Gfo/Idh/MocA family oxidoreductase [archaeon]|nr:Gfo/Idh/MocA family oxidoreductase [archaeon]
MKNILVIGGGSIGKRHMRNLLSIGEKNVFVVEPNEKRALEEIEKKHNIKTFRSLEEAYDEINFDIAFVCSPSVFHIENAMFCAEKGSDLFIEKPLSHNLEKVDELLKIVKDKKLITMIGSNWKFYPLFKKMKELIDGKAIGKIFSARCQFGQYLPGWHPWEDYKNGYSANKKLGGGVLLDSHEFDYLTWFLGGVKKLACFADKVSDLEINTEDVAETILQFESGVIAEIHVDYLQRFYQRKFEFFGELGTIKWDTNEKSVELLVINKEKEVFNLNKEYDINDMYIDEVRHFLDSVQKRQDSCTNIERGAEVLRLICASKESSLNNSVFIN